MTGAPRVRIAPSPTGDPHVGTAYTAQFNRAFARANHGTFILRIDDTDRTRYRADSEAAILRSLAWLGLDWDEGPDIGGPHAPYRQSERTPIYRRRVEEILAKGAAYRCFCDEERLERLRGAQRAEGVATGYDRACRDLSREAVEEQLGRKRPHVVRLRVPLEGTTRFHDELRGAIVVENSTIDDQVLLKSDGFPTYHLANVVDDIAFGITHVIRAEEWIISTPKHVLLYAALGEPLPKFFHLPLLRNEDHSKISKRKNPVSIEYYRKEGYLPEALLNFLANMGWSSPEGIEVFDREHFERHFRPEAIHLGGPVFDLVKLRWLNGVHLRRLDAAELARRLRDEGFLPAGADSAAIAKVLPLVAERLHLLSEFSDLTRFYFEGAGPVRAEDLLTKKRDAAATRALLGAARDRLALLDCAWDAAHIEPALEEVRTRLGLAKPELFMPLRMALTGRKDSPPIFEVTAVLGQAEACARIDRAQALLA